jgi:F-type H+/Na+-transporting ATPase subunit alpha
LRLDLAQYRELAAFAQFGSDQLDKATQAQLARGQRLTEILKQGQFSPLAVEEQVLVIFAGTSGLTDDVAVADIQRFEKGLIEFVRTRYSSLLVQIAQKKQITDEARADLKRAIGEYKEQFQAGAAAARA